MSVLRKKISRLALFDGAGLLLMGMGSLCVGVIWRDFTGGLVGLALLTLGAIELHGRQLLMQTQARATGWLVGAQIGLLFVILSYCFRNVTHPPTFSMDQIPATLRTTLESLPGYDASLVNLEELMPAILKVAYSLAMLISIFYQGGMAMFYLRKTPLALAETSLNPPPLPPMTY